MNYIIKEFQKLYEKTPVSDRFIRARIQSGMRKSKRDVQKLRLNTRHSKYKMSDKLKDKRK